MNDFLEACQAAGPIRLTIAHARSPEAVHQAFAQPYVLIGNHPAGDLVLRSSRVSKRHAYLQIIGGRLFGVDLGSRTGVLWPHGAGKHGWLDIGQELRIGSFSIRLEGNTPGHAPPWAGPEPLTRDAAASHGLPPALLEFIHEGQPPWRIHPVLTLIGAAPECKVRLSDPGVSWFHASLVRTPAGMWVVDLLSRTGLLVNQRPIRCARLEDGDLLQIGKFAIRLHCPPVSSPFAAAGPGVGAEDRISPLSSLGQGIQAEGWESCPLSPTHLPQGAREASAPTADAKGPRGEEIASFSGPPAIEVPTHLPAALPGTGIPLGGPPDQAGPLLLTMVNQFALMQQQTFDQFQQVAAMQQQQFDQFQQAVMGMAQMFGAMHKEQTEVLREELQRLRELTLEINHLQAQSAKGKAIPAPQGPAAPATAVGEPGASAPGERPVLRRLTPPARPASPPPAVPSNHPAPQVASAPAAAPVDKPAGPAVPPAGAQENGDVYLWLAQRMQTLQEERQSRWQKVLGFLTGKR
jgi:pSer/pThr/pTyr-binding forkhead associated (FHA) protein